MRAERGVHGGEPIVRGKQALELGHRRERLERMQHVVPHIKRVQRREHRELGGQRAERVAAQNEPLQPLQPPDARRERVDRVEREVHVHQRRHLAERLGERLEPVVRQVDELERLQRGRVCWQRKDPVVHHLERLELRERVERDVVQLPDPVRRHVQVREGLDLPHALRDALERKRREPQHAQVDTPLHEVERQVGHWVHRQVQAHNPVRVFVHEHRHHLEAHPLQVEVLVGLLLLAEHGRGERRDAVRPPDEAQHERQILPPELLQTVAFRVSRLEQAPRLDPRRALGRQQRPLRALFAHEQSVRLRVCARLVPAERLEQLRGGGVQGAGHGEEAAVGAVHAHHVRGPLLAVRDAVRGRQHRVHVHVRRACRHWLPARTVAVEAEPPRRGVCRGAAHREERGPRGGRERASGRRRRRRRRGRRRVRLLEWERLAARACAGTGAVRLGAAAPSRPLARRGQLRRKQRVADKALVPGAKQAFPPPPGVGRQVLGRGVLAGHGRLVEHLHVAERADARVARTGFHRHGRHGCGGRGLRALTLGEVRLGVHVGAVARRIGGQHGPAVGRHPGGARLLHAGHPLLRVGGHARRDAALPRSRAGRRRRRRGFSCPWGHGGA